jgi:hypothetical protein
MQGVGPAATELREQDEEHGIAHAARTTADGAYSSASEYVAADPARAAIWRTQAVHTDVYVASGCGQQRRYRCVVEGGDVLYRRCYESWFF